MFGEPLWSSKNIYGCQVVEIKMSFEEQEFIKRMLQDSVRGMEKMQFFWYQFIRKFTVRMLTKQYRELLKKF